MVGDTATKRDIVLHTRGNALKRISETHRSYDALQYPLLFPCGDDGYSIAILHKGSTKKTVSAIEFYAYRLMVRKDQVNTLHLCRALFNQYLVDQYACIETERLNFIKFNQAKLRAEEYSHLMDSVTRRDAADNMADIGKLVILPSSFTGNDSLSWYTPRFLYL